MITIDLKLEAWKNKLLDLGKRNRLLNYRDTKRSNLRIKKPTIFELWDNFVVDEAPLEFLIMMMNNLHFTKVKIARCLKHLL